MADDIVRPQAAAAAVSGHGDVIDALLNLKGAIHLAREAVYGEMNAGNERLEAAEGVLSLAAAELARIHAMIDCGAVADAWPASSEETTHD